MEIVYVYTKKRREFGRRCNFSLRAPELLTCPPSHERHRDRFIIRNPSERGVQCAPCISEHSVNTERFATTSQGILHLEGGWPKDVDPSEVEHTIRFRKKVEKDEDYIAVVRTLGLAMEHVVKQNNTLDIYEDCFGRGGGDGSTAHLGAGPYGVNGDGEDSSGASAGVAGVSGASGDGASGGAGISGGGVGAGRDGTGGGGGAAGDSMAPYSGPTPSVRTLTVFHDAASGGYAPSAHDAATAAVQAAAAHVAQPGSVGGGGSAASIVDGTQGGAGAGAGGGSGDDYDVDGAAGNGTSGAPGASANIVAGPGAVTNGIGSAGDAPGASGGGPLQVCGSTGPRTVASICWHSDGASKLVAAYAVLDFHMQQMYGDTMGLSSYIWDLENPNAPQMELTPSSPLCCVEYNPKDSHAIVGGSYNGLVGVWDTRKGCHATDSSLIEASHRDPVYSVKWIQSKTATEFISCSTDGTVLWWDMRRLAEPIDSLTVSTRDARASGAQPLGAVTLDYDVAVPSKFMIGTEHGRIVTCTRKAKNREDRIIASFSGHHGPVYAVRHSPFFPRYFLSVGDWTTKIWNEELSVPIMTSAYHRSYLRDGCWSPTRPGVFCTSRMDGVVDIWDYLYKQSDTVLSLKIADVPVHCLRLQERGSLLACGARDGSLTLLELSEGLSVPQPGERATLAQIFDRETKREKILETRAKELRAREQNTRRALSSAGSAFGEGGTGRGSPSPTPGLASTTGAGSGGIDASASASAILEDLARMYDDIAARRGGACAVGDGATA